MDNCNRGTTIGCPHRRNGVLIMDVEQEENALMTTTKGIREVALDWLELPENLTSLIMSKLSSINDYARFGAVCVKWRSILRTDDGDYTKFLLPPQLPLLMIPTPPSLLFQEKSKNKNKKKKKNTISCSFYRVTDGKIFNRLRITMPRDRYVRGSGHGWLVTVDADEICFSVQLINPFFYPNTSTKEIKLPPLTAHPFQEEDMVGNYGHLLKAVLSADPVSNPKEFMVVTISGEFNRLSFCKPGDKAWIPIRDDEEGMFLDLIHYKGRFYALSYFGAVVVCNLAECSTTTFAGPPRPKCYSNKKYLVVSAGEFYQVHRFADEDNYAKLFKVFKLQRKEAAEDWIEVKDLCGRVFFIGDNTSMSISASDFPGCKPNCIYYTDDDIDYQWYYQALPGYGPHDFGMFNLESRKFKKHYQIDGVVWPAPIWIEPVLMPRSIQSRN